LRIGLVLGRVSPQIVFGDLGVVLGNEIEQRAN
jgi:hypothetical protein